MAVANQIRCTGCGAPYDGDGYSCDHCGAALVDGAGNVLAAPVEKKDFGWEGKGANVTNVSGALAIYLWGCIVWRGHWGMNNNIIIILFVILPLWIIFMSAAWRTKSRITFLLGLIYAIPFTVLHFLVLVFAKKERMNDWTYAQAAIFFGFIYLSWCAGRILHQLVRKRMFEEK